MRTDMAWICELGSEGTHGAFDAFVDALAAWRIDGDIDALTYHSPSLGLVETGWGHGLRGAGSDVQISGYPLIGDAHTGQTEQPVAVWRPWPLKG